MPNYIKEQEQEDIQIVDIYWDRIYLHIKLAGQDIYDKEYVIATRKEKYKYSVKLDENTDEIVINITNIENQEMLCNGDWYIKYYNKNFEQETVIFEEEMDVYLEESEKDPDYKQANEKPWKPYVWKDIPVSIETCYKMKDLDKIYRYSGENYAYIFSFAPLKTRGELICKIKCAFMMKNRKPKKRWFTVESKKKENNF